MLVREVVEQAVEPLHARIVELEPPARGAASGRPPSPCKPPRSRRWPDASPVPARLSIAPSLHPASTGVVRPAPLLDVAAIERDVALDPDLPRLDGRGRKRRMMTFFFSALVVFFGGLFALLAESWPPRTN